MHGSGAARFVDGATYDGQWVDGQPHGEGVMTAPNGASRIAGKFVEGHPRGPCVVTDTSTGREMEMRF